MTRIGNLLVQDVDGTGVVIVDESAGEEVFIPLGRVEAVRDSLNRFVDAYRERGLL